MLLLAADSLLLLFITWCTGYAGTGLLRKVTGAGFTAGFLDIFLTGLLFCFIWFNLVSFFAPVNYISLLPLLLLAVIVFAQTAARQAFFRGATAGCRPLFSGYHVLFTLAFLGVFFVYWITPPSNPDSNAYHFVTILWYEKYKLVPGLGNLHGRLAFNPASFIISAAWSFTSLAGQPLYPLNGVLTILFYGWLLKKILAAKNTPAAFVLLLCGILLFRNTLSNISAPSSDTLATFLVFYIVFRVYENIREGRDTPGDFILPSFFLAFAATAKLSALPLGILFCWLFFFFVQEKSKFRVLLRAVPLLLLLIAPWIIRNFIMSGYLAYPILHSNLFAADWAVPESVIKLEHLISHYYPRMHNNTLAEQAHEPISRWFFPWLLFNLQHNSYSAAIYIAALLSPLLWVAGHNRRYVHGPLFVFWALNYINVWIWLWASPDARYGLAFHVAGIGLPLLTLTENIAFIQVKRMQLAALFCTWLVCIAYGVNIFRKPSTYRFTLADCWLKPLRSYRYYKSTDKRAYPYRVLNYGIRLYTTDATHDFLNAPFPAVRDNYLQLEMRGPAIEDGFRVTGDDTKKYIPFLE